MNSPRTTLYRDKQNAKLMGVCSGIADYTGVNVFWVRLGLVGLTFFADRFVFGAAQVAARLQVSTVVTGALTDPTLVEYDRQTVVAAADPTVYRVNLAPRP